MQIFATKFPLIAIIAIHILKTAHSVYRIFTPFSTNTSVLYTMYIIPTKILVRDKYVISTW